MRRLGHLPPSVRSSYLTDIRFVHLATHGFFAAPTAEKPDSRGLALIGDAPRPAGPHPGLLSGVVLAGANKPTGEDDGYLTALEVGDLDLGGVDLAVLSACETGLGRVAGGEGVLGLQRAFQVAGARTTVTSLWKVDDAATRRLMYGFYYSSWTEKMGRLAALRDAQLDMLRTGPGRAGDGAKSPPYYWAAFVLAGDWR